MITLWSESGKLTPQEGDANFSCLYRAASAVTISGGVITVNGTGKYKLGGEGAVADDLTQVLGTVEGDIVIFRALSAAQVITVKNNANLKLAAGDFILNSIYDSIILESAGSNILFEHRRTSIPV